MCSVFLLENAMYKKEEMTAKEWLRPNLILVCGLPGSGKTTIARRLEQETGAIRLNIDEWVAALGVDFFDFEFRLRLESRLYEHGITLLKLGQSIILGIYSGPSRSRAGGGHRGEYVKLCVQRARAMRARDEVTGATSEGLGLHARPWRHADP